MTETQWLQTLLFDLINRRYNAKKPTIFSSNYSLNELVNLRGIAERTIEYHTSIYSELPKNFGYNNNMIEIFISRIEELEMKKAELQIELDEILDEFTFLSENSYKILIYRCIENLTWDQISKKTGYSKTSCFRFWSGIKKYHSS